MRHSLIILARKIFPDTLWYLHFGQHILATRLALCTGFWHLWQSKGKDSYIVKLARTWEFDVHKLAHPLWLGACQLDARLTCNSKKFQVWVRWEVKGTSTGTTCVCGSPSYRLFWWVLLMNWILWWWHCLNCNTSLVSNNVKLCTRAKTFGACPEKSSQFQEVHKLKLLRLQFHLFFFRQMKCFIAKKRIRPRTNRCNDCSFSKYSFPVVGDTTDERVSDWKCNLHQEPFFSELHCTDEKVH